MYKKEETLNDFSLKGRQQGFLKGLDDQVSKLQTRLAKVKQMKLDKMKEEVGEYAEWSSFLQNI